MMATLAKSLSQASGDDLDTAAGIPVGELRPERIEAAFGTNANGTDPKREGAASARRQYRRQCRQKN